MHGSEPRNIQDDKLPYRPLLPTSSCNIVRTDTQSIHGPEYELSNLSHMQSPLKWNCCSFVSRVTISCSSLLAEHPTQLKRRDRQSISAGRRIQRPDAPPTPLPSFARPISTRFSTSSPSKIRSASRMHSSKPGYCWY